MNAVPITAVSGVTCFQAGYCKRGPGTSLQPGVLDKFVLNQQMIGHVCRVSPGQMVWRGFVAASDGTKI